MKYKLSINLFIILVITIISITSIKAQNSCPVFIPKPATFVSANKAATVGNMSYVLDGEGSTGLPSSGQGNVVYWLQSVNPVTFYFDMKASSTISRVKFYQPWGFDEGAKNVTVRLYNGATLLGTEAIVLPSLYAAGYIAVLSKTYTNVTKIQMVIVDDYNISGATPKRTSLKEVVFGDTTCIDTDGDTVADYLDFDNDNDGIKDIDENCSGFLAQNTSGTWKGKTTSNLTATLTGATAQANIHAFSDGQIRYYVNQNGGDPRYYKAGTASFTYNFSTPIPANEIAFFVDDIDPSLGSTNASVNFKINGGDPNGNFVIANYSTNTATYLNYNPITGVMSTSSNLDDQRLIIKGVGDILVSSITITNSGIPTGDGVAYALLANHPCDTDGDGIANIYDLDSDGDGCTDAIEGAGNFTSSQLTTASGAINTQSPNQNFGNIVDTDGIPTIVGTSGQAIGQSQDATKNDCIDSDGDGVSDWQDLDDDNDGILDTTECPTIKNNPVYHLFPASTLWLYKNKNGIGSSIVCITNNCSTAPNGTLYFNTNITSSTQNLAYDDGKYYMVNSAGDLLYTNDILDVPFTSLGNAHIGTGYKNLGYDNGVFYHWEYTASLLSLYSSTDPVDSGWTLMGTVINRPYSYTASNGITYVLKDIAVNNGEFYFLYYYSNAGGNTMSTANYTSVFTSFNPVSPSALWVDKGSTYFGSNVMNIAWGSEDILTVCDTDGDTIPDYLDLDSDNDGCPDAIEGGANFTNSDLVNSAMLGGNSSATSGTYNQPVIQNLGNNVGNTVTTMGAPTIAGTGQSIGDSQNFVANSQCTISFCYKPATTTGTTLDTNHGITALGRAGANNDNWPMIRKGAWTALEAKTKGFVVNRITTTASVEAIPNPVEGMMVYDEEADCLKINTDGTTTGWKCFNTQACPD